MDDRRRLPCKNRCGKHEEREPDADQGECITFDAIAYERERLQTMDSGRKRIRDRYKSTRDNRHAPRNTDTPFQISRDTPQERDNEKRKGGQGDLTLRHRDPRNRYEKEGQKTDQSDQKPSRYRIESFVQWHSVSIISHIPATSGD